MILLTGGSGLLGTELQKYVECWAPSRREFDITWPFPTTYASTSDIMRLDEVDLIVHCAAFTDLVRAEKEKELCYQTNVIGTRNVASLGIPMVYISTEYVFDGTKGNYEENDHPNPQNFYALTKLLGEYEARRTKSVVIRCLFKPGRFEHDSACTNQYTSGDTVDKIAPLIAQAVKNFNDLPPTIHIGTRRKSTFEIAVRGRPDVRPCLLEDIKSVRLPRDTSLTTKVWDNLKEKWKHD